MTSITSGLFLISKCSRITSLQSIIFQFLRIKRFVKFRSVYELFSCKQDNQGFLAFTYQVSPLAKDYDVPTRFQASRALSLRFALCALRFAHSISGRVLCHQSFTPCVLHPSHDAWLCKMSRTQIQVYSVAKYRPYLSHFWENLIVAIPFS